MQKTAKTTVLVVAIGAMLVAGSAHAAVIGSDTFDYTDGNVAGHVPPCNGGVGWAWNNTTQTQTSGTSTWYRGSTRNPYINTGGMYTNNDSYAMRTYSNPEADGSVPGTGRVYYGVTFTRTVYNASDWTGIGSYATSSKNTQKAFFGAPYTGGFFGIYESAGNTTATSTIPVNVGQEYRIVSVIDFDGDQLRMWVNPDGNDYDAGTGNSSADIVLSYSFNDASTAVGLNSNTVTRWDDVVVANDPVSVGLNVPEPASLALLGLGGLACIRRKR
jgi:hypothetical protein